uniref:Uncharacterized protein n=1 Tax=viral metagenome TaxID=1070528 RepID=A0A6M3KDZ9_9ZZZZ
MKCGKFMHWAFGKSSWMCRKLRICLCKPSVPPTPPVPPVPPEPPIEYVTRDICIKTGLLALDTCEAIGCVKIQLFVKGDEPTIKCDRHNHWAYKPPIAELHIGGYFYLWQLRIGWDEVDRVDALEELFFTLRQARKARYSIVEGFVWLDSGSDEHAHLNGKTPWVQNGELFDLSKPNPRYWDQAEDILRVFKEFDGLHFQPCLFMRESYNARPIHNNVNGVTRLKTEAMIPFAEQFAVWWLDKFRVVYGDDYNPYFKDANEWMHGSPEEFRFNGYFHWRVCKALMDRGVPLSHFNVDVSHSEGTQIFLNEPYPHPKLNGEVLGYAEANRNDPAKSILAETHGLALVANLLPPSEKLSWLGSKWVRYKLSGDGGSWSPENPQYANGYRLPGTKFYFPSLLELEETLTHYWTECKRKGKRGYYCHWVAECFRNDDLTWNLWQENCKVIDWNLASVPAEVWEKIY